MGQKRVNKTKAVMDYLHAYPDATNREILVALRKNGIVLTPNFVSVIKAKGNARRNVVKMLMEKVAASRGVRPPEVKVALFLLRLTGGVEGANHALTAVKKAGASRGVGGSGVKVALALLKLTGGVAGAKRALEVAQEVKALV
jgi:hypothetical protein